MAREKNIHVMPEKKPQKNYFHTITIFEPGEMKRKFKGQKEERKITFMDVSNG